MSPHEIVLIAKFGGPLGVFLCFLFLVFIGKQANAKALRVTQARRWAAGLGVLAFAIVTLFGWLPRPSEEVPTMIQKTTGPNSPAVSNTQGDVNIQYGDKGDAKAKK